MSILKTIATGSAAVNTTYTPSADVQLEDVRIHLSAAGGAANMTVTLDSGDGAAYDIILNTQDMTAITDYLWQPTRPIPLKEGDKIVVAWANGSSRTYGLTITSRTI